MLQANAGSELSKPKSCDKSEDMLLCAIPILFLENPLYSKAASRNASTLNLSK